MPDCFISYASQDEKLARFVPDALKNHGLQVFMAAASLQGGQQWSDVIKRNIQSSRWVIFLASRAACRSAYVQQELGIALGDAKKRVVPIVWEIDPSELPGWINQAHALDLRGRTIEDLRNQMTKIATEIKQEKKQGYLILGALVAAFIAVVS